VCNASVDQLQDLLEVETIDLRSSAFDQVLDVPHGSFQSLPSLRVVKFLLFFTSFLRLLLNNRRRVLGIGVPKESLLNVLNQHLENALDKKFLFVLVLALKAELLEDHL